MTPRPRALACLSIAAVVGGCSRSHPGGFTATELVHRINGKQERETVSYGAEGVKFSGPDGTFVLRFEGEKVTIVDDAENTYRETTLAAFAVAQKEKQHQPDLPDVVGEVSGSGLKVEASGEPMEFAGIAAKRIQIAAEKLDLELLMTDALVLPGPRHATYEFLHALGGPLGLPAELFDRIPGFPLRSIVRVRGGMWEIKVARAVLSIERTPPPPETFAPPAGYRKAD